MEYQFNVPQSTTKNAPMSNFIVLSTPEFDEYGNAITPRLSVKLTCLLMEVSGGNNIDLQRIEGMSGTIKTFVNRKDFEVKITGKIVEATPEYPFEATKELREILSYKGALEVESEYLLILGIYNLVVTDYSMGQMIGTSNVQPYEIFCLSDAPIEILEEI